MMRPRSRRALFAATSAGVAALALTAVAVAQVASGNYELSVRALAGGGRSTGGQYDLRGAIGQPFAQQSTGGSYTMGTGLFGTGGSEKSFRYTPQLARDGSN